MVGGREEERGNDRKGDERDASKRVAETGTLSLAVSLSRCLDLLGWISSNEVAV